jgi:hypothetical protein
MKDSKIPQDKKIKLFDKIYNLILTKPNNYDLGEVIRELIQKEIK